MLTTLISRFKSRFTSDLKQIDWPRTGLLVLMILAIAAALWQYAMPQIRTITTTEFRRVPEIRGTAKIERVYVACPDRGIVTLDKEAIAKKLDISWLQGGDIASSVGATHASPAHLTPEVTSPSPEGTQPANLQVTATAAIPESDDGVDILSLIDLESGETTIVAKERPAPWFQFRNDAALGVRHGYNQHLTPVTDVYGKWDFLRVKNLYLGVSGDLSTGGDAKLQFGAEYRWQ